jgi:hypothetical protein
MANVLTTGSTVTCLHDAAVTFGGQTKLRFGTANRPVLVRSSVLDKDIAMCGNSGTGISPCKKVTDITSGLATKLRVGTDPVLLESLAGLTNGTVSGVIQPLKAASAGQAKLTAQ